MYSLIIGILRFRSKVHVSLYIVLSTYQILHLIGNWDFAWQEQSLIGQQYGDVTGSQSAAYKNVNALGARTVIPIEGVVNK